MVLYRVFLSADLQALEEASCSRSSVRDSGFAETWYPDREVPGYRREDSVESLNSVESHTLSVASDCTLVAGSEGRSTELEFAEIYDVIIS